jgi:hypothetical protein
MSQLGSFSIRSKRGEDFSTEKSLGRYDPSGELSDNRLE